MKESKILLIEDDPDHADIIINALKDEEIDNDYKEVILRNSFTKSYALS